MRLLWSRWISPRASFACLSRGAGIAPPLRSHQLVYIREMLQLTLLLLGDALSHNGTSHYSHAPSTTVAHHSHRAKNATQSPGAGVVEREKRVRGGSAAKSTSAHTPKQESERREPEPAELRAKGSVSAPVGGSGGAQLRARRAAR